MLVIKHKIRGKITGILYHSLNRVRHYLSYLSQHPFWIIPCWDTIRIQKDDYDDGFYVFTPIRGQYG